MTSIDTTIPTPIPAVRYAAPGRFTRRVFNPMIAGLTRAGISVWGSRVLEVPGRATGQLRSTPVNLLDVDGRGYLVAPRGETHWVKNVRAAGGGRIRVGRRVADVALTEVADADKPAVLRPYLRRWKWEVGQFFDGLDANATDADLLAVAVKYPVFAVAER